MLSLERNGYTASQVDAQLHSPVVEWHFQYNLLDKNNVFKKTLTTVTSGHVGYDTTQKIRRTAKFTMQDDSSVNFLSDRIQPHALLLMPDTSYPTELTHGEKTQSDFESGTLSNVKATSSGLQLPESYKSLILGDHPVAYYRLDETSGTTANDSSGNGNNGTITGGVTFNQAGATADGDKAMNFDGSTGYISLTGNTTINQGNFTFEVWLNSNTANGNSTNEVALANGTSWIGIASASDTPAGTAIFNAGGTETHSTQTVNDGRWHHIVGVKNGTTQYVYVDGAQSNSYTGTFNTSTGNLFISSYTGTDYRFPGLLDEVAIYNYALTQAQIQAHYNASSQTLSGSRTSNAISLSSLGTIQSSTVSWTANTPANTSVGLQASTDGGATWNSLTNGGSLVSGNPTSVMLRENLSTTDTTQTPTLQNVTVSLTGSIPGGYADFPLGVFILSTPPRVTDPAQVITRQIDAYDLLQVLVDDKVTTRYTVTAGTKYTDAIKTLLTGAGFTNMNIQDDPRTLPASLDWAPGIEKLQIANDLGTAINYRSLWMDENGQAQGIPYQSPSVRAPEYTYIDDSKSVMFPDMTQSLDLFAIPNEWVLTVTEPDRTVITSTYTNTNPNSPTSTVNRGRTIVKLDNTQQAPDQATLDAIASKMAYTDSQVYEQVEFGTAISPIHSDTDVFNLTYSVLGITYKVSETAWDFDLVQGARMIHRVQNVVSV